MPALPHSADGRGSVGASPGGGLTPGVPTVMSRSLCPLRLLWPLCRGAKGLPDFPCTHSRYRAYVQNPRVYLTTGFPLYMQQKAQTYTHRVGVPQPGFPYTHNFAVEPRGGVGCTSTGLPLYAHIIYGTMGITGVLQSGFPCTHNGGGGCDVEGLACFNRVSPVRAHHTTSRLPPQPLSAVTPSFFL